MPGDSRRIEAGIRELLDCIRGILADGEVTEAETLELAAWAVRHPDLLAEWPANVLVRRLTQIFEDGRIEDHEREELKALLLEVIGEDSGPAA